jgi:hypothetical protein
MEMMKGVAGKEAEDATAMLVPLVSVIAAARVVCAKLA